MRFGELLRWVDPTFCIVGGAWGGKVGAGGRVYIEGTSVAVLRH